MKKYSSGGGSGTNHRSLDESEVYFSTYMSPPSHKHHSSSKHVSYKMPEEPKMEYCSHSHAHRGWDDVDDEATDFIQRRHRKLQLTKFMSMAP